MLRIVMFSLSTLLLAACSSKPSESTIEKAVMESVYDEGGRELIDVANFKQVNGFQESKARYLAHVTYDMVLVKSADEFAQMMAEESNGNRMLEMQNNVAMMAMKALYGNWKAGDKFPQSIKVQMIKSENGWVAESMERAQ